MEEVEFKIEERKKVWIALSDLFLDTDVSLEYDHIAKSCAESQYSISEIKEILDTEVAPVCAFNLISVAGEWAGFNEEWLIEAISKSLRKRKNIIYRLFNVGKQKWISSYAKKHWLNVSERIEAIRNSV